MTPTDEQLERWAAEKVMEWHHNENDWCWLDSKGDHTGYTVTFEGYTDEAWHPTRDLNQTFMCVEKMREKGWWLVLDTGSSGPCYAEFRKSGYKRLGYERNFNPARAIHLAMWRVMEGK